MATRPNGPYTISLGAEDLKLGEASTHSVSRFRMHVTAVSGTITIKATVVGEPTAAAIAANVVTTVGSTTTGSTITATGLYDIDAAGLAITVSSGTSCTFSYFPVEG